MAKDKDTPEAGKKGVTRTQAEGLIERYFGHKAKIEKIMAEAKKKAEGPRADMGVVIDDAERIGLDRKAFKKVLKRIDLVRQIDKQRDEAETDVQDAIDHLEEMIEAAIPTWEDTPLGKAMANGGTKPAADKTSATVTELAKKAGATPAATH